VSPEGRETLRDTAIVFILALGARLFLALSLPHNDTVFWDQPYWEYAKNFSEGRGFWMGNPYGEPLNLPRVYAFRPPLFPLLWGCVFQWTHGAYAPVRVAFAFLGALSCVLAYLAGMEMTGRRVTSAVAGILCAFYPPLIWHSVHLMTEPLFIFLSLLCLYAAFVFRRTGRLRWALLAGLAGGLAALTRSMFIGFLPLLGIWVWWGRRRVRSGRAGAAVFCAAALLALAPWIVRNAIVLKAFVPTTTDLGHGFYGANNERSLDDPRGFWAPRDWSFLLKTPGAGEIGEVEASRRLVRLAGDYLWNHPRTALRLMARRFTTLWGFYPNPLFVERRSVLIYAVAYVPLFPLVLVGLWLAHRRGAERLPNLLLVDALILYTTAIHVVILAMMRYREPLMPYLLVFAAAGIVGVVEALRRKNADGRIPNA